MRRKKANVNDMFNIGVEWFDFHRCQRIDETGKVIKGTRYLLDKPMTEKQKEYLSNFKNVIVSTATYRYAPEIQYQTLIITDVCLP